MLCKKVKLQGNEHWVKQPVSWLPHLVDGLLKDTVAPHKYIFV